jgi:type I restriction enzyme S subunit
MSFPRYPKYKPSGVEWLGDVPEGWDVKRSDSFLTYSRDQLDPKDFQGSEVFHYSIPVVQETGTGQIEDGAEIASGKQIVKKKVVLVSKLNPRKGTICIAEPQQALTLCSTEFVALEPNGCDIRYLSYLVRTEGFRQGLESKVTSVTNSHQRANPVDIYRFWNAWPVLAEQTAIAEFLDRETGKIDGLVAEQRRLMELLKEKRQAVISHAVTKGLNPHAPMKPSGIEWLGDVPAGWTVRKVSQLFRAGKGKNGQMLTKEFCGANEGEYPVYSGQTENEGVMGTWDQFEFDFGDAGVLFSTTVGAKAMHLRQLFGRFSLSQNCMIIWTTSTLCITRFFYYHFQPLFQWQRSMIPDHMQPSFRMEDLYACAIALPPTDEQSAIVAFLDSELFKFDTLTAEAQRAIDLLQERRTALISAAVTGQIDVRNHAPKEVGELSS